MKRKQELEEFIEGIPSKAFYRDLALYSMTEVSNNSCPHVAIELKAQVKITLITDYLSGIPNTKARGFGRHEEIVAYSQIFVDQPSFHIPGIREKLQSLEAERLDMAFRFRISSKMDEIKKLCPMEALRSIILSRPDFVEEHAEVSCTEDQESNSNS